MKRSITLALVFSMVLSLFSFTALAANFPDVPSGHWAQNYINQLVNDGTVKGFEDGTFHPNGTVLRAEFVKMIGKGPEQRTEDFKDVPATTEEWGWAYDYIMYSGLEGDGGNNFNPGTPITRGDVAQLLWQRAGRTTGIVAPSMITKQYTNPDAAAWVYQYGIMQGNDGLDLRMGDSLTRAEAAALIVRGREVTPSSEQKDFISSVSPDLLGNIFSGVKLTDGTYAEDRQFTNGEVARMAVRLATEQYNLTYQTLSYDKPFEHPYARDLSILGHYVLGDGKVNQTYIDQKATVQDALVMLTFGLLHKTHNGLAYGTKNNYYKDAVTPTADMENVCLTFAYEKGVQLYKNGKLNAAAPVNGKQIAAMLLQLDGLTGLHTDITTDYVTGTSASQEKDHQILKDITAYPDNKGDFQTILADLPSAVYSTPFQEMTRTPKEMYDIVREYGTTELEMLRLRKERILKDHGISVRFTYFPSLVCKSKTGMTMRVKMEVVNAPAPKALTAVLPCASDVSTSQMMYTGMECYLDISTGAPVVTILMDDTKIQVEKIIAVVK